MNMLIIIIILAITYFLMNKKEPFIINSNKYMLPDDPYVFTKTSRFLVAGDGPHHFVNYDKYYLPHWYATTAYYNKISPYLDYSSYIYGK